MNDTYKVKTCSKCLQEIREDVEDCEPRGPQTVSCARSSSKWLTQKVERSPGILVSRIISAHMKDPNLSYGEVAEIVGTSDTYVRAVAYRNAMVFPKRATISQLREARKEIAELKAEIALLRGGTKTHTGWI